ncbi:MAG: hypothetical protein KJ767_00690, partial [Nanoarchaeota archaeon]|nr:hypothetical protein [Nanoarchaeota archaeon]
INELKANQSRVNLEAEVISIGEIRTFLRFGRAIRVTNADIKDDTGETKLTLWNGEVEKVKVGDKVRITNGYVKDFQGQLTVTAGKFGKLEVIDGEGTAKEQSDSEDNYEEKPQDESNDSNDESNDQDENNNEDTSDEDTQEKEL